MLLAGSHACCIGLRSQRIVEEAAEARSGVLALMEDALSNPDVAVAICSAATKEGFIKVKKKLFPFLFATA